ncbi:MAG: hypothetical protein E7491_07515 [Ruminococcaceae bacterium]|nr:hypothetical protein [Oscillospiraceae bacterium]
MLKRLFALIMALMLTFGTFTVMAEEDKTSWLTMDFEHSTTQEKFAGTVDNTSISYQGMGNKVRVVEDEPISGRKSLQINTADMRWWSMSVEAAKMFVTFKVKATEKFANTLALSITTQDRATDNGGMGGKIIEVTLKDEKPVLCNVAGDVIAELERDVSYTVTVEITRGSAQYDVLLNGEKLEAKNFYISPIYYIAGMRIDVFQASIGGGGYVFLDDVEVYTPSTTPQKYSTQEIGDIPEVVLPEVKEQQGTYLFYNTTQVELTEPVIFEDETAYIPLNDLLKTMGGEYESGDKGDLTITAGDVTGVATEGDKELIVGGDVIELTHAPKSYARVMYVPANLVNELFKCKVWYDEHGDTIVISDSKYANDDILRIINGKLYQNGEPYYEISFNKFDLAWQISADYFPSNMYPSEKYTYEAAERALAKLNELGFRSIRVFCSTTAGADVLQTEETKAQYYEAFDKMFDLCDKYDIQVVVCMGLPSQTFLAQEYVDGVGYVRKNDTVLDLITKPDCESRQTLYSYIEEFVGRYKDRKSVLMWEIVNEGNLEADIGPTVGKPTYSLMQLGAFYKDCAEKIRQVDPERLITGGDSVLRPAQWNLFEGTMVGLPTNNWLKDNMEQRLWALWTINSALDVISCHGYSVGIPENGESYCYDEDYNDKLITFEQLMDEAKRLGKVLYNGETGGAFNRGELALQDPAIAEGQKQFLDEMINAGVQLTHWWAFNSDRQGFDDNVTWNVTEELHGFTLEAITEANKEIQAKYVVNGLAKANTAVVEPPITPTPTEIPTPTPTQAPTATPTVAPEQSGTDDSTPTPTEAPDTTEDDGSMLTVIIVCAIIAAAVIVVVVILIVRARRKKA